MLSYSILHLMRTLKRHWHFPEYLSPHYPLLCSSLFTIAVSLLPVVGLKAVHDGTLTSWTPNLLDCQRLLMHDLFDIIVCSVPRPPKPPCFLPLLPLPHHTQISYWV
jgi:hypothetical protein